MKKLSSKNILLRIGFVVVLIILLLQIAVLCLFVQEMNMAKNIYKSNSKSILELKCESNLNAITFGTALIIDKQGYIITNYHIININSTDLHVYVRFCDEKDYCEVDVIKCDEENDLALLKIKEIGNRQLRPVKFATNQLNAGDRVFAMGNSLNQGITISEGIVGMPKLIIEYDDKQREVIQADITINNGNSGGALLNSHGKVVGITAFRIKDKNNNIVYGNAYCIPNQIISTFISDSI